MLLIVGDAKLQLSADAEAVDWLRRSIQANRTYPLTHFVLAAALALLGSLDEARAAARAGLALDPSFTIRRYRNGAPSDNPTFLASQERIYQGMRMASSAAFHKASLILLLVSTQTGFSRRLRTYWNYC